MRKALVVVDMQNDFIDGVLGNAECQAVVPKIVGMIENGDYSSIVVTRDTHYEHGYLNTQEGKKLPVVHCVKNTDGWNINADIMKAIDSKKPYISLFTIDKNTFGSLTLIDVLQDELSDCDEIDFCGVCTGICVISNVAIAKATLPETKICVIEEACACVTPDTHKTAIEAMKTFQVDII